MKKTAKALLLICLLLLLLLFIGYFLLAYYYRGGFSLNTWINGVYCTGKTVEEVNAELLAKMEAPIVIITDRNGDKYYIDMANAGYQEDYIQSLNSYLEEQNSWRWIENVLFQRSRELEGVRSYSPQQLREVLESLDAIRIELNKEKDYVLEYQADEGYVLHDGLNNRMDVDLLYKAVLKAVDEQVYELDMNDIDCYYDIPLTDEQKTTKSVAQLVEALQNSNIIYDMGDEMIPLEPAIVAGFLKTENGKVLVDENGRLVPDEEAITAFVDALAEEYDTFEKEREFLSTRGDVITVTGVTYGTQIDREAEVKYLTEMLFGENVHSTEPKYRIPEYIHEGMVRGKDDIGDTYIEIDMTEQMMYYYKAGELKVETPVVTGNTGRRWGTPEGVNYVYNKQKNRILRGEGYASPVKYWMPVKGNIGIHDASWRDEFGGTIYQKSGSHGCINTPTDKMAELYEMVEIGTPVILFY